MIRPVTVCTLLLACGSGLYLYQSKHQVQLLDQQIEHTVHQTEQLREQSRLLATEWRMLNNPDRLKQFSDQYLPELRPINPQQIVSLADLANHLPPVQVVPTPAPEPLVSEVAPPAVAPATEPAAPQEAAEPAPQIAAAVPHPVEKPAAKPAEPQPSQHVAETKPAEQHPAHVADARPAEQHSASRVADVKTQQDKQSVPRPIILAEPRRAQTYASQPVAYRAPQPVAYHPTQPVAYRAPQPTPVQSAPMQQQRPAVIAAATPAPYYGGGGSLLGMARSNGMSAAPRPTPVDAN